MGDPTTVYLRVLNSQSVEAQKHFTYETSDDDIGDTTTEFTFEEVGYGELPFLEALTKAGIAYDSSWSRGDEYGPGTESLRFDAEGKPFTSTLYESGINPELSSLMALIDKPDELRTFLLEHQADIADRPWDNQEKYGKIYLAKQLINPT